MAPTLDQPHTTDTGWRVLTALYVLCALGLLSSLLVHISTFLGIDLPRLLPFYLVLGAIPIGLATLSFLPSLFGQNARSIMGFMWRNSPRWLKIAMIALILYVIATLFSAAFILNLGGTPDHLNGHFVLQNHGTVLRVLSEQEFKTHVAYETRWLSTIPLLAYFSIMVRLYVTKNTHKMDC